MSLQDTKERIFINGQIYSRPRFGGPVSSPDNRRFTPDPNPYDVEPESRGYGEGSIRDFLNQYINDRGITEQNQEVMGAAEQVFPRYANPEDGTLNNKSIKQEELRVFMDELLAGAPRFIRSGRPANAILKTPHIDSPHMDAYLRRIRGVPPVVPGPRGPQLFPISGV